jgi:hypothetical protein
LLPDTAALKDMLRNQIPAQAGFTWDPESWRTHEDAINAQITNKLLRKFSGREIDTLVRNAFVDAREKKLVDNVNNVVDASVLVPAIQSANISSNYRLYVLWSLYALRQVDASDPILLQSVKEVIPDNIVDKIIVDNSLSMMGIAEVTQNINQFVQ